LNIGKIEIAFHPHFLRFCTARCGTLAPSLEPRFSSSVSDFRPKTAISTDFKGETCKKPAKNAVKRFR
jgi:hypothetical protein